MVDVTRWAYAAFISYSHAVDGKLAPAIHMALQRFAKPWYRRRTVRIFRDEASLAVNPSLWSAIERALVTSEFFILLASPESARSHWVNRELEFWLSQSSPDRLLIILTDGEIAWDRRTGDFEWDRTTAVPRTLAGIFREEPLYLDLRWARSERDLTLKHPAFHAAIADLAATVRGWDKDEIVGEDIRQHKRTVRLAWLASGALAGLAVIASAAAALFLYQRSVAQERELEARQHLYTAHVNQALAAARASDMERAGRILQLQIPGPDQSDLRGFEWYFLWRQSHRELATYPGLALARIAFSPDGKLLAAGGAARALDDPAVAQESGPDWINRGELRIWDVASGRRQIVKPVGRRISGIAFSPDGRRLAAVTQVSGPAVLEGNDVIVLSTESGEPLWTRREKLNFDAVAFHPSGTFIATGGQAIANGVEGRVDLWDIERGTQTTVDLGRLGWVRSLAFSPAGDELAIAWDAGPGANRSEVWIWNLAQRAVRLRLTGGLIMSIAYSPDGARLIAGGDEGAIAWWSLPAGTGERVTRGHRGLVLSLAVAPNSRVVVSAGSDQAVLMWDINTGETIGVLPKQPNAVEAVAFAPDGRTIATSSNAAIKTWNVSQELGAEDTLRAHAGRLGAIAFAPDGATFATGGEDGVVALWLASSAQPSGKLDMGTLPAEVTSGVKSLVFSPERRVLAATGEIGTRVWDVAHDSLEFWNREAAGEAVAFSRDGARLLVGSQQGVLSIELATKQSHRLIDRPVEALAVSPDGTMLATAWGSSGPSDSSVWIWDASSGERRCELRGHDQGALGLGFSPDGSLLASGGYGSHVKIWDVRRCAERMTLPEHEGVVASLAFSPDGRTLAVGHSVLGQAEEAYVALWSTATWEELFRLPAGIAHVRAVRFSADGKTLAAAGDNSVLGEPGTVRFWRAAGPAPSQEP
jgi:WD40 repeat protein